MYIIHSLAIVSGGEMRPGRGMMNFEFTFDLFVCAAILTLHRDKICQSTDAASVYGCLNRLAFVSVLLAVYILEHLPA